MHPSSTSAIHRCLGSLGTPRIPAGSSYVVGLLLCVSSRATASICCPSSFELTPRTSNASARMIGISHDAPHRLNGSAEALPLCEALTVFSIGLPLLILSVEARLLCAYSTLCALGVRDAYLTGLKSRSCQQLPGVVLASLCGACSSLVLPRLTREPSTHHQQ